MTGSRNLILTTSQCERESRPTTRDARARPWAAALVAPPPALTSVAEDLVDAVCERRHVLRLAADDRRRRVAAHQACCATRERRSVLRLATGRICSRQDRFL